jgi:hypothetical protein
MLHDPAESQIRYVLEQNAARLAAASCTQDELMARLSELAAASWKPQSPESMFIAAGTASTSPSTGTKADAFLQLCVDCGLLVQADANRLRFRDEWLHGYLAARGLVRFSPLSIPIAVSS